MQEYHSSAWEQRWLADADNLQKDACNAMKQDAELGKHWVEQAHLAHESNYLPNNSLWSYFEYANACHEGQHLFIPIEPLVSSPKLEHTCDDAVCRSGLLHSCHVHSMLACRQPCPAFKVQPAFQACCCDWHASSAERWDQRS